MRNPLLLSLLSVLCLVAGWLNLSGLPLLFALVPLMIISERYGATKREWRKMLGWVALVFGLWSGITTWWIWYAAEIGAILSVIITILLFGGSFMLYHYVSKRATKALSYTILVAAWISMEYLYTVGEISFPWIMLGNGFANDVKFIQWYEYTGIFGGTLWVLLCNILIFRAITTRSKGQIIASAVAVLLPIAISLTIYYSYQEKGEQLKIAVVQPNIEPYEEKFVMDEAAQMKIFTDLLAEAPGDVNLIVLPETAIDDRLVEVDIDSSASVIEFRNLVRNKFRDAQFIVGATTYKYYQPGEKLSSTARTNNNINFWYDVYNSALAIDSSGVTDIHHKSKLVVGAEKMPYYNVTKHLEFLIVDLGGITGQLGFDSVRKVFYSPTGIGSGAAICYESIYGEYFTEFVRNGARIMTVVTNDGWWYNTLGHRHHFSYSRLRAIETRRSVARSANTGISGFISQRGEVTQKLGWDKRGLLVGELRANDKITFYVLYGDYIGRLSAYIFVLCLLYYVAYRVRKRNHLVK